MPRYQQAEESIYDLIPIPAQKVKKAPRHRSKYPHDTPPTGSTFGRGVAASVKTTNLAGDYESNTHHKWKQNGGTFGKNTDHYSDPTLYLQKNTKSDLPQPQQFRYQNTRKGPTPKVEDKPAMGRRTNVNFVKENALTVIMAEPKVKTQAQPRYTEKEDFGQVPAYLENVKREIAEETQYIQDLMRQEDMRYMDQAPQMQLMDETERMELLTNLKNKWESVNGAYQLMTHKVALDTIGKQRRKEEFESQLSQLEKLIDKVSKPLVFIQADQQFHY